MRAPTIHWQGVRRSFVVTCATEARGLLAGIEDVPSDELVARVLEALAQLRAAEDELMAWSVTS